MEIENEGPQPSRTIPIEVRWEIVRLKKNRLSGTQIEEIVHRPASTCNSIYRKFLEAGTVNDLPRSGRPLKVTEEVQNKILTQVGRGTEQSVNQIIEEAKVDISDKSARRVLKSRGVRCKTAKKNGSPLRSTNRIGLLGQRITLTCLMSTGKE